MSFAGTCLRMELDGGPALVPGADARPTRFHGNVSLDATRAWRDASRIADEVITHLAGLVGTNVTGDAGDRRRHSRRCALSRRAHGDREQPHAEVQQSRLRA